MTQNTEARQPRDKPPAAAGNHDGQGSVTGFATEAAEHRLLRLYLTSLPHQQFKSDVERNAIAQGALAMMAELDARDAAEGMLAAQMVAAHHAAMDCLALAANHDNPIEARQESLKQANKLMALYTKQVETLDKHRGRGHGQVNVERVSVSAGGQAIVGNVNAEGTAGRQTSNTAELEYDPGEPMPMSQVKEPAVVLPMKKKQ